MCTLANGMQRRSVHDGRTFAVTPSVVIFNLQCKWRYESTGCYRTLAITIALERNTLNLFLSKSSSLVGAKDTHLISCRHRSFVMPLTMDFVQFASMRISRVVCTDFRKQLKRYKHYFYLARNSSTARNINWGERGKSSRGTKSVESAWKDALKCTSFWEIRIYWNGAVDFLVEGTLVACLAGKLLTIYWLLDWILTSAGSEVRVPGI